MNKSLVFEQSLSKDWISEKWNISLLNRNSWGEKFGISVENKGDNTSVFYLQMTFFLFQEKLLFIRPHKIFLSSPSVSASCRTSGASKTQIGLAQMVLIYELHRTRCYSIFWTNFLDQFSNCPILLLNF